MFKMDIFEGNLGTKGSVLTAKTTYFHQERTSTNTDTSNGF